MKLGSIELARTICEELKGELPDGEQYGSVDVAEILSAYVRRLEGELEAETKLATDAMQQRDNFEALYLGSGGLPVPPTAVPSVDNADGSLKYRLILKFDGFERVVEGVYRAPVSPAPSRDWPEDFAGENGNYSCRCSTCGNTFIGYKRRVTCKLCAEDSTQA